MAVGSVISMAASYWLGLRFGLPLVPHALSNWVLRLSDRIKLAPARSGNDGIED